MTFGLASNSALTARRLSTFRSLSLSDYHIMAGSRDGSRVCFIQVKSCHPDRSATFILNAEHEAWTNAKPHEFVVFVWLGSPQRNESLRYWIATKKDVGMACKAHPASGSDNWERRFSVCNGDAVKPNTLSAVWENNWSVFAPYAPASLEPSPPVTKVTVSV
jgi:hypothetical protein